VTRRSYFAERLSRRKAKIADYAGEPVDSSMNGDLCLVRLGRGPDCAAALAD